MRVALPEPVAKVSNSSVYAPPGRRIDRRTPSSAEAMKVYISLNRGITCPVQRTEKPSPPTELYGGSGEPPGAARPQSKSTRTSLRVNAAAPARLALAKYSPRRPALV